MRLDPARAAIAALPLGRGIAYHLGKRVPADRARCAYPKACSRLTTRRTFLDSRDHTLAKINR